MKRAHCDVAARSCLVGYGKIVKITNLGMSADFSNDSFNIQPIPNNALVPVRWTPPEVDVHILTHTSTSQIYSLWYMSG